jgi:hypothetical protein
MHDIEERMHGVTMHHSGTQRAAKSSLLVPRDKDTLVTQPSHQLRIWLDKGSDPAYTFTLSLIAGYPESELACHVSVPPSSVLMTASG